VIRTLGGVLTALLAGASLVSYFPFRRQMQPSAESSQHYVVIDETTWKHARPDLGDIRIFTEDAAMPYRLTVESGGTQTEQRAIRVLQPGSLAGKTQFFLDMSGVPEYDRATLQLAAKNFVAHARVDGQDDLHGSHWVFLGNTTLYDLSNEKLGRNSTLQMPLSAYKYLRVVVDESLRPAEVEGGSAGVTRAEKAVWQDVRAAMTQTQQSKDTILTFTMPPNLPVERLNLEVDASQPNFRRDVEIQDDRSRGIGLAEVSRVHWLRNGRKVDAEHTSLEVCGSCREQGAERLKVVIHNGDDAPLKITGARLQQYQRRMYFDSAAGVQPWIYYGDQKLSEPQYDYAKLFQKDAHAQEIALNAEEFNTAFTGRPDERPWSERHPAVLWAAILAAVTILGSVALRSLKGSAKPLE
jgi:hypothetical protein